MKLKKEALAKESNQIPKKKQEDLESSTVTVKKRKTNNATATKKTTKSTATTTKSKPAGKNAPATRKKRSFTGCVTCRNRKIKCDGRRPGPCERCEKSGVPCLGYDIKLKFSETFGILKNGDFGMLPLQNDVTDENFQRRTVPFFKFPKEMSYKYLDDIDPDLEYLSNYEEETQNDKNLQFAIGPFSCFTPSKVPITRSETIILNSSNKSQRSSTTLDAESTVAQKLRTDNNFKPVFKKDDSSQNAGTVNSTEVSTLNSLIRNNDSNLERLVNLKKNSSILGKSMENSFDEPTSESKIKEVTFSEPMKPSDTTNTTIVPRKIWIHPRLRVDAILTYRTLVADSNADCHDMKKVKQVVFSDYYNRQYSPKSRIIDKFNISKDILNINFKKQLKITISQFDPTCTTISFRSLIANNKSQELIRLFVRTCKNLTFLSFKGSIWETIIVPLLYKLVGEMLVIEIMSPDSDTGYDNDPNDGDTENFEHERNFNRYSTILKQTIILESMSIAAFSQSRMLFNDYGEYHGFRLYFALYIHLREISLINISYIIKSLIGDYDESVPIEIKNNVLLDRLINSKLIKEFMILLILAIKQDELLNVLENYKILFHTARLLNKQINDLLQNNSNNGSIFSINLSKARNGSNNSTNSKSVYDEELETINLWFSYMDLFYRNSSAIDVENYIIDEEGYEDLKQNYNLISHFQFNDYFKPNEYNKIVIKPKAHEIKPKRKLSSNNSAKSGNENSNNTETMVDNETDIKNKNAVDGQNVNGDEDEDEDSESSDSGKELPDLPTRLAKRPQIEDKPPRSYTIRFHFNGEDREPGNDDEDDSDDEDDDEDDEEDEDEGDEENYDHGDSQRAPETSSNTVNIQSSTENMQPVKESNTKNTGITNKKNSTKTQQDKMSNDPKDPVTQKFNSKGEKVDALTGLTSEPVAMSFSKREQLTKTSQLLTISIPFNSQKSEISPTELSFGIPKSLFLLMVRTVQLADHRNWFIRKKLFPRNFPRFCCDLEDDLMNWKLPWDLFDDNEPKSKQSNLIDIVEISGTLKFHSLMHEALYHSCICFYNALILFFYRLLKDTDPSFLQGHVVTTISHLESLHRLACDSASEIRISAPFWPFFISGSDALTIDLQQRVDTLGRVWYTSGDKWIGKQIMFEIWRGRNGETIKNNSIANIGHAPNTQNFVDSDEDNIDGNSNNADIEDEESTSWLDVLKGWELFGFH